MVYNNVENFTGVSKQNIDWSRVDTLIQRHKNKPNFWGLLCIWDPVLLEIRRWIRKLDKTKDSYSIRVEHVRDSAIKLLDQRQIVALSQYKPFEIMRPWAKALIRGHSVAESLCVAYNIQQQSVTGPKNILLNAGNIHKQEKPQEEPQQQDVVISHIEYEPYSDAITMKRSLDDDVFVGHNTTFEREPKRFEDRYEEQMCYVHSKASIDRTKFPYIFSIPYNKDGKMHWVGFADWRVALKALQQVSKNEGICEITSAERPVKMCFDLETYHDTIIEDGFIRFWSTLIQTDSKLTHVKPVVAANHRWVMKNDVNQFKQSYHVIVPEVWFRSFQDQKNWVSNLLKLNPQLSEFGLDTSIYRKDMSFRTINSTKFGSSEALLKPIHFEGLTKPNPKYEDYFISCCEPEDNLWVCETTKPKKAKQTTVDLQNPVGCYGITDKEEWTRVRREKGDTTCHVTDGYQCVSHDNQNHAIRKHFDLVESMCFSQKCTGFRRFALQCPTEKIERLATEYSDSIQINCNNHEYVSDNDFGDTRIIGIRAGCGLGKTEFAKRYIDSVGPEKSVLIITNRCSLHDNLLNRFGDSFESYQDADLSGFSFDVQRIVIQWESLHKLPRAKFDIVICDEVNSLLKQASSITNGTMMQDNWSTFETACKNAERLILMDADILHDESVPEFVRSVLQEPVVIHDFMRQALYRRVLFNVRDKPVPTILESLRRGEKVFVVSKSLVIAKQFERHLIENRIEYAAFHSDKSDKEKRRIYDINSVAEQVQCILITSTVTVGVDIQIPFDKCFVLYNHLQGPADREIKQMTLRVRNLRDETITVFARIGKPNADIPSIKEVYETLQRKGRALQCGRDRNETTGTWVESPLVMQLAVRERESLMSSPYNLCHHFLEYGFDCAMIYGENDQEQIELPTYDPEEECFAGINQSDAVENFELYQSKSKRRTASAEDKMRVKIGLIRTRLGLIEDITFKDYKALTKSNMRPLYQLYRLKKVVNGDESIANESTNIIDSVKLQTASIMMHLRTVTGLDNTQLISGVTFRIDHLSMDDEIVKDLKALLPLKKAKTVEGVISLAFKELFAYQTKVVDRVRYSKEERKNLPSGVEKYSMYAAQRPKCRTMKSIIDQF